MSAVEMALQHSILQAPWSGMTLPGLLAAAAKLRPDAPFIVDGEAAGALTHRPPRRLGCRSLMNEAERLAGQLLELGLAPGEAVILHLPNIVEASIALLGVQIAGGVPAPVPVFEDKAALAECIAASSAACIITIDEFAGLHPALRCREAALSCLTLRFVAAFGPQPPAGVVALDAWTEKIPTPSLTAEDGRLPALITFDAVAGRRPLLRRHEHLIADGAAVAALAGLSLGSRILTTIPPSSLAGVTLGLTLPLLVGAVVELNPLFDSCAFAEQIGDGEATVVALPGASEPAFRQFCEENDVSCDGLILIHRPAAPDARIRVPEAGHVRCIDALCLGESLVAWSRRADERELAWLPERRRHPLESVMAGEQPLHQLSSAEGGLTLAGPGAPTDLHASQSSALQTGYAAQAPLDGRLAFARSKDAAANAA